MVEVDFCVSISQNEFKNKDTDDQGICAIETIFSIIPIVAFIFLGYYSYKESKGKTPYVREKYTPRHIVKIAISGLNAAVCLTMSIVYPLVEDDISLKTEIAWCVSFILWVVNSVLMRHEYKNLGFTTPYLRYAWITMLICQTVLLVLGEISAAEHFEKVELIYYLNEIVMLAIIVIGFAYSDDFPPTKGEDVYGSIADPADIQADESFDLNRSRTIDGSDPQFKPFVDANINNPGVRRGTGNNRKKFEDNFQHKEEAKEEPRIFAPQEINLKNEVGNIESIEVVGVEEIIRLDKKTIVYQIEFYIRKERFLTKRSYNEFKNLYKEIMKTKPTISIPDLPPKTLKKNDEATINTRKETFNTLLKLFIDHKIGLSFLAEFLQPPERLPFYGKLKKSEEKRMAADSLLSTSDMGGSVHKDEGEGRPNIIPDYTGDKSGRGSMSNLKTYQVETIGVSHGKDAAYYELEIKEITTNTKSKIIKRYKEFKTLHEELKKKLDKKDRHVLPELPYKGNVGISFGSKDEARVVEYRKVALKTYLQNLLNNPKLQDMAFLQEFIRSK